MVFRIIAFLMLTSLFFGCGPAAPAGQKWVERDGYALLLPATWRTFDPERESLDSLRRRLAPGETAPYFVPEALLPTLSPAARPRIDLYAFDALPRTYGSAVLFVYRPESGTDAASMATWAARYLDGLARQPDLLGRPVVETGRYASDRDARVRYATRARRADGSEVALARLEYLLLTRDGAYVLAFAFGVDDGIAQAEAHIPVADAIARSFEVRPAR